MQVLIGESEAVWRAVCRLRICGADKFFVKHLDLTHEDARMLHGKYYKEYGLAIEGLARHHRIEPLEFNRQVDDALPLDRLLRPDAQLRRLLEAVDRSRVKLWLLTNAYITHAQRVVRLLGVADLFEGVTYCDYAQTPLVCKPSQAMYAKAEREAGASSPADCYFVGTPSSSSSPSPSSPCCPACCRAFRAVDLTCWPPDDSAVNCKHARLRGWTTVHLVEPGLAPPPEPAASHTVRSLDELRSLFPDVFGRQ